MKYLWVFAHLMGIVLWLGAALSAMAMGINARREPRENQGVVARQLAVVYRQVMMPGVLLTVTSGLILTLMIYGGPGAVATVNHWLMTMQATGLIGAVVVLVFAIPAASRAAAVDPIGPHAPVFDQLRQKTARLGLIAGTLGMIALVTGAFMRS